MKFKALFILLAAYLMAGCKKTDTSSTELPVVQAYLFTGRAVTLKLYHQKSLTDTANYGTPITGLQVYVSDGSRQVLLSETAKGTYTYADTSFIAVGKTYSLSFNYSSKTVSAKTTMLPPIQNFKTEHTTVYYTNTGNITTAPDTLNKFTWDNPDSLNHILVFDNVDDTFFTLNGGTGRGGSNIFDEDLGHKPIYFVVSNSFPYYGNYQVVLLRVNQEYMNLFKSTTLGANSQNLLNTPTNVVNGLGIFTAMQSDTLLFKVYQ